MASCIARCSYLFRSSAEKNIVSLHRSVVMRLSDTKSSSKLCYGTRGADDAEDTHVHIPLDRLTVSYSRSSGPGGQNVNKGFVRTCHVRFNKLFYLQEKCVNELRKFHPFYPAARALSSKTEVRFHLHTADWIPEDVRQKVLEKNKNRITKAGELLVTSEVTRSQQRNLSDCIQKISAIIAKASEKPRQTSAEDIALRAARLEKRNNERLKQKKIHSAIKQSRRVDFD